MKKENITRFKLNPNKPPTTDWRAFDAMTEEERHQAAMTDSDALPAADAQLARARRVPSVRALRKKLNLTQEEFAARFRLPIGTVRDWEQAHTAPTRRPRCCLPSLQETPTPSRALSKNSWRRA